MDYIENIGKNIRSVRTEKGLSQQALADKCGFSNTTLSAYENGKKTPGLPTTAAIAKNLGVSIERLYYGDENNSFINSVSDDGRKIVNSIYLLWEKGVVSYNDLNPYMEINNVLYRDTATKVEALLVRHTSPILRLLNSLCEFARKRETFSDPEGYLEMLLSSVASEINQEIADERKRMEQQKK